jgi:type VI secretion system VasD/TssJ family lipoprotein
MPRALLPLLALLACKPRHTCEDPSAPVQLQMLATADPVLNPNDDGSPWPTVLRIYQLRAGAELDALDFDAVFADGEKSFGPAFIKVHEFSVFPDKRSRWNIELDKDAAQVVTVGLFRQPVGDAWYQVYNVPQDHNAQRCAVEEQGRDLPDPCLYLAFEHSEITGGQVPARRLRPQALFETTCAPVGSLATKKTKKKRTWRDPKIPKVPTLPSVPTLPQTPVRPRRSPPRPRRPPSRKLPPPRTRPAPRRPRAGLQPRIPTQAPVRPAPPRSK